MEFVLLMSFTCVRREMIVSVFDMILCVYYVIFFFFGCLRGVRVCVCFVISVAANVDNLCLASYVHTQCGIDYAAAEMLLILCYRCYTFYGCQYVVWSILLCVVFFPFVNFSYCNYFTLFHFFHIFFSATAFAHIWRTQIADVFARILPLLLFDLWYISY